MFGQYRLEWFVTQLVEWALGLCVSRTDTCISSSGWDTGSRVSPPDSNSSSWLPPHEGGAILVLRQVALARREREGPTVNEPQQVSVCSFSLCPVPQIQDCQRFLKARYIFQPSGQHAHTAAFLFEAFSVDFPPWEI